MKYIDEFRDIALVRKAAKAISQIMPDEGINLMEVCGTHTQSFLRFGLKKLLPENLKLISGPGCPVCVSTQEYIDKAIIYSQDKDVLLLTFGDMMAVPGTASTLEKERARGAQVGMVYSALQALSMAKKNPNKKVIFLAVGFETTAPTIALSIMQAKKENIRNLFFFSSLKQIVPAMNQLARGGRLNCQGFLCPGHVSAIIGARAYEFIPRKFGISCCVAGFEPLDMLEAILLLLRQRLNNKPRVDNQYSRVVTAAGNLKARKIISRVFKAADASWRGLGNIRASGLELEDEFRQFDAQKVMPLRLKPKPASMRQKQCRCAEVLKGLIAPEECALFGKTCTPLDPYGPCMVSIEGACNAYYKYR